MKARKNYGRWDLAELGTWAAAILFFCLWILPAEYNNRMVIPLIASIVLAWYTKRRKLEYLRETQEIYEDGNTFNLDRLKRLEQRQ